MATRLVACILIALMAAPLCAADKPLVAHWDFDEGKGDVLHDRSGNENHGKIHGAKWVKSGKGCALRFDGVDDFVDCGQGPSLSPREALTMSAWVRRDVPPRSGEPALITKGGPGGYALTLYTDVRSYTYVSGAFCWTGVAVGSWNHVVATFDGRHLKTYRDGKLCANRPHRSGIKPNEEHLLLGKWHDSQACFEGMLDEVKIYNRALSAEEVGAAYREVVAKVAPARSRVTEMQTLRGEGYVVRIGSKGGVDLEINGETYFVDSSFSYPAEPMGYNRFPNTGDSGEPSWKPEVRRLGERTLEIRASGRFYAIVRKLELSGHRVAVSDTLTNVSQEDVGVLIRHTLRSEGDSAECLLCGALDSAVSLRASENPTVLLSQQASSLGALAEDNVSRVQIEVSSGLNQGEMAFRHLAVAKGRSLTLEWALYPCRRREGGTADDDYWTFINRIRDDWGVNFRLLGSWRQSHVTVPGYWERYTDPEMFAAYVKRSKCQVVAIAPYVDYDNYNHLTGKLATREEFKTLARKVKKTVKSVDPSIKVIGMMEAPTLSLPQNVIEALLPTFKEDWRTMATGFFEFTAEQTDILKRHPEAWERCKDSVIWTRDGRLKYEFYRRGGLSLFALFVYPVLGNGQDQYLMEQARFLIEDVGLDGTYVDSFAGAKSLVLGYSYDKWDGITVDIDPGTGRITSKYTDTFLAGADSRKKLIEYVLSAGGTFVANGHAIARQTQALPAFRFNEGYSSISPSSWEVGEEPPLAVRLCAGQLSSPLHLGLRPYVLGQNPKEYASVIMKMVMGYLRHGALYYHYGTEIPETGPGGGEYGALNHMYPITPVRLGKGFVEGKERIVTAVSGSYEWSNARKPNVLVFDIRGYPVKAQASLERTVDGWTVELKIKDWAEIAVVE